MGTATTSANSLCSITNNSGVDIAIGSPIEASYTDNAPHILSYNKDFELFGVAKGGNVIKNGDTDIITFDRTYVEGGTTENARTFDLLISSSTWLSPLTNIGVSKPLRSTSSIPPKTISADDVTAIKQATAFYQTIAAYPDSQLAKDYLTAMSGANDSVNNAADGTDGSGTKTSDAIDNALNDFFANTKSYQKVTLPKIVQLEDYYETFPFAWAQCQDSTTYYLYSSTGQDNGLTFAGSFTLQKSGDVDISKPNGGYTCTFTPSKNPTDTSTTDVDPSKAKPLTYSDGIFTDDVDSDMPGIALKGTFMLKRTFTKNPDDTQIIVVISGTVNGVTSIGFDQAQLTKKDDPTMDWLKSLFDPQTASGIFSSVMTILGALMMLHFVITTLWGIGKWIKNKVANGDDTATKDELKSQRESIEPEMKAKINESYSKISGNKGAEVPESSADAFTKAAAEKASLSDKVSKVQLEDKMNKIDDNLSNDLAPYEGEVGDLQTQIDDLSTKLGNYFDELTNVDIADLKGVLENVRGELKNLSDSVVELNQKVQDLVAENEKATMDENVKDMQDVQEDVNDEKEASDDEAKDGTSEEPEGEPMEFPDLAV